MYLQNYLPNRQAILANLLTFIMLISQTLIGSGQSSSTSPTQLDAGAQLGEEKVFLPVAFRGSSPINSTNGSQKIINAGKLLGDVPCDNCSDHHATAEAKPIEMETQPEQPVRSIVCSVQDWEAKDIREIERRVLFSRDSNTIYPGALIQGKNLYDGNFTPITIPRAGGTIHLTNLEFEPGKQYSTFVSDMTASSVNQAVHDLLVGRKLGGASDITFDTVHVSSHEELALNLEIGAKFIIGSVKNNLALNSKNDKSYIVLKFIQTFYDINFDHPTTKTSVFRDGENFADPEGQITPGNPPLYVEKVSYGRILLFAFESDYSEDILKDTLQSAIGGGILGGEVRAGLEKKKVLEHTRVTYVALGGSAGLAVEPIASGDPQAMFDAVKKLAANTKAAEYSPENPGVPIKYSLRYLATRDVARMSYFITYGQKSCKAYLEAAANVVVNFTKIHVIKDGDDGLFAGDGEISCNLSLYNASNGQQPTVRYPENASYVQIGDGGVRPVEKTLSIEVNPEDEIVVMSSCNDDGLLVHASDNYLGLGRIVYGYDTEWGTFDPNERVLMGRSESTYGAYDMYFDLRVDWVRPLDLPNGSYQHTCRSMSIYKNTLKAICAAVDGSWHPTTLNNFHHCKGDIANMNGSLQCPMIN